ncbi:MAG: Nif3-like dinuclear metal center hexameric protein [Verrucomicrobiota bacterium]
MARLSELIDDANEYLDVANIPDYPGAVNGLQVENNGEVTRVAAAVDSTLPVIEKAVAAGADLLVVHHGLFWQGAQPVTKANYRKLKLALDNNLAIYSVHIPLDVHPVIGNNALLAKACGLDAAEPFFPWKGILLGLRQKVDLSLDALMESVTKAVGGERPHVCPAGPEQVKQVGIITGGAGSEIAAAASEGVDTFITGEGPHWSYGLAEELGINVIYAGHYATETFGVKGLVARMAEKFGMEHTFIDHPTGI